MPNIQIQCPQCQQPIIADIQQLFDVSQDPSAKQKLLSGTANFASCKTCGYQGPIATPIVYHDAEKELLLTYFPPEIGKSREEQEQIVGPLINKVFNSLPQEKRKAYLFNPQTALTMRNLIERILEADGITREMIEAQENRLNLIQRLLSISGESRKSIIEAEDNLIDAEFLALFSRLLQATIASGDEQGLKELEMLQNQILEYSTYGKKVKEETEELNKAIEELSKYESLSYDDLIKLVSDAPNESRLRALVRLLRNGMDYTFFQKLTELIEKSSKDKKKRLEHAREKLLEYIEVEDKLAEAQKAQVKEIINQLLKQKNYHQALLDNPGVVDQMFINVLQDEINAAKKVGDVARLQELMNLFETIQQMATPPKELIVIEDLIRLAEQDPSGKLLENKINEMQNDINDEVINLLTTMVQTYQQEVEKNSNDEELEKLFNLLSTVYTKVIAASMKNKLNQ